MFPERITAEQVERLAATVGNWTESALISTASYFAQAGAPLPAWAARAVADWLPGSQRSVVLRRVGDEFRDLFAGRYRKAFPDGLVPKAAKRPLRHAYRPANSAIGEVSTPIPNPLGAPAQFKPLAEIWNGCLQELKKLSSMIAKAGGGGADELTPAAWEALPPELRAGTDHPLADAMCQLVERSAGDDGHVMVGVAQLATTLLWRTRTARS